MANFTKNIKKILGTPEDENDYDYDEIEQYDYEEDEDDYVEEYRETTSSRSSGRSNKVVNINATAKLRVVLFKPESFGNDTRVIADELINMNTVVLNLEGTEREQSRRILDFLSGCAYANNGQVKRVASSTFIIIPNNVDLTGDELLDELENSGVYF